jgi:propionate CoA-transferase
MNLSAKIRLLSVILRWRLTWKKNDLEYRPKGIDNPKFMTAMEAVRLIKDGSTTFSCGMAGNARPSVWFWAIERLFRETGHPRGLTHIIVGAQGGRGRIPGTLEELGKYPGLITRLIAGHIETLKTFLKLADQGALELHTLPQGIETLLIEAQGRGRFFIESDTGAGTFLDPRVGNGSVVVPGKGTSLVEVAGDDLRYSLPKIDTAYFIAPAADREGNIYVKNCALFTETRESALAAKANGGRVLVSVAQIIDKQPDDIFLPAEMVDAVAVHPYNEQTVAVPQKKFWPMFTEGAKVDPQAAMAELQFVNRVLGITPIRGKVEDALARLAASIFTRFVKKCCNIIIGVGLPEEVARLIHTGGLFEDVTFMSETGVIGGLPAPGVYFGAGVNPREIISSAQIFHLCYEHLDCAVLGILEVDSQGNVNVSKRGEGPLNYVGPGGFPDFCAAADTLIFVGSWMANAKMEIRDKRLSILKSGTHKFIKKVGEITMSGEQALKKGKTALYVTNVGVFRLTNKGMMLIEVMPGVDIEKDIMQACPMQVILPESGQVPVTPDAIVTGEGFRLNWQSVFK